MRDVLVAAPKAAAGYTALKYRLAPIQHTDLMACTRARTAFLQTLIDAKHDRLGWPRMDVREH